MKFKPCGISSGCRHLAVPVTLAEVYNELKHIEARMDRMVTGEDLEAMVDTLELLNDPEAMEALHGSDEDIEAGRTRKVTSVQDLLRDC